MAEQPVVFKVHDANKWRDDPKVEAKILKRMALLVDIYNKLQASRGWEGLKLNRPILAHALHNYILDIDRYKAFHNDGETRVDHHKVSAFAIKWIVKCKPIQVEMSRKRKSRKTYPLFANELYAFYTALNLMDLSFDFISSNFLLSYIYKLHFRPTIAETILTEMYAIEKSGKMFKDIKGKVSHQAVKKIKDTVGDDEVYFDVAKIIKEHEPIQAIELIHNIIKSKKEFKSHDIYEIINHHNQTLEPYRL